MIFRTSPLAVTLEGNPNNYFNWGPTLKFNSKSSPWKVGPLPFALIGKNIVNFFVPTTIFPGKFLVLGPFVSPLESEDMTATFRLGTKESDLFAV